MEVLSNPTVLFKPQSTHFVRKTRRPLLLFTQHAVWNFHTHRWLKEYCAERESDILGKLYQKAEYLYFGNKRRDRDHNLWSLWRTIYFSRCLWRKVLSFDRAQRISAPKPGEGDNRSRSFIIKLHHSSTTTRSA